MADCCDWPAGFGEGADKLNGLFVDAKQIRIDLATWEYERVIIVWVCVGQVYIHIDVAAPIVTVPTTDFFLFWGNNIDLRADLLQSAQRYEQFGLLKSVRGEDCDL